MENDTQSSDNEIKKATDLNKFANDLETEEDGIKAEAIRRLKVRKMMEKQNPKK